MFSVREDRKNRKDELWDDPLVLLFICRHGLSMCKEDYTLQDLELIKQKMESEKQKRRNQQRKVLDELLYE